MRKSKARIRAEALALSAMMASMNVMPALADSVTPEIGIEASKEDESGEKNLASSSNATPVEEDNTNKEIETEENEEDTEEDFEFEEELENDLESSESSENEEDTESSESEKDSSVDSENETKEDMSETEEIESELETEVDLDQIQVATPSDLEKPEEKLLEPELMTLSLREVVYGEWNDSEDGNWKFLPSEDGTCSIKPLSPTVKSGSVTVPEEVDGFTVTSIGASAWNKQKLTEINMSGIKVIETSAFRSCKELKSITLSDVDTIEDSAFYGSGLTSITLDNVGTIETNAFRNCTGLTELNLGTIGTINTSAFNGCSSLTELEIESADTIETYAFYNCAALNNITIRSAGTIKESSVLAKESIHIGHADDIQGMIAKNITIDSAGTVYVGNNTCENMGSSVGNDICETISIGKAENIKRLYANNEIHISDGGTVKGTYPAQPEVKADKVTIDKAECVHKIDGREIVLGDVGEFVYDQALDGDKVNAYFRDNTRIETVSIESVASIPDNCFKFCSNLKNITIGHTDYIGDEAFKDCTVLESISASVDNNIDVIGRAAFMNCQNLKKAEFNNVGTIREYAFQDLQALNTLKINDVGSIEKMAFHNCPLLEELTLGEVGTIGEEAFTLCDSLRTIKAGNVNEIGEAAFKQLKSLTSIVTGDIQNIGAHAFMKCKALETVNIGEVQNMGECAFAFCENLNTLNWTNNLKALPDFAFYKCGKLTSFDLGNVESIGVQALFKCNGIKELTVPAGVESVYLVDLPGEYDYSGKADFSRGYKLTFLGDTDFQHSRSGSDWWCGWLNDKLNDKDDPEIGYVPEIDWRDSIIINEFVLPSKDCKAYKRMTDKNNTDIIPKIEGDSKNVLYHAVNDELRSKYINEFTSEETTEYHWSSFRTLPDVDGNDNQHVIIEAAKVNGNTEDDNKEKITVKWFICKNQFDENGKPIWTEFKNEQLEKGSVARVPEEYDDNPTLYGHEEEYGFSRDENHDCERDDIDFHGLRICPEDNKINDKYIGQLGWFTKNKVDEENYHLEFIDTSEYGDYKLEDDTEFYMVQYVPPVVRYYEVHYEYFSTDEGCGYKAKPGQCTTNSEPLCFISKGDWEHPIYNYNNININDLPLTLVYYSNNIYGDKSGELDWYTEPELINKYEFERNEKGKRYCKITDDLDLYYTNYGDDVTCGGSGGSDDNKEKITITYHSNDDTENDIFHVDNGVQGEKAPDFTDIPTRENHKFIGWYTEPECINEFDKETVLEGSIDLYAKWEENTEDDNKEKITVTFWMNDGTENIWRRLEDVEKGSMLQVNHSELGKEKYEFTGWYMEPECENKAENRILVEKDLDLYAGWKLKDTEDDNKEKVTVTFYRNDGTEDIHKREEIEKNTIPSFNDTPTRDHHIFIGWYKDPEGTQLVDINEPVGEDTNYYAKWEENKKEKIKVTFYYNDGTPDIFYEMEINKGDITGFGDQAQREKYDFTGWYEEPECKTPMNPSKPLEQDTNFYAGWKANDNIIVNYWMNDGIERLWTHYETTKGSNPDLSYIPESDLVEGKFLGWYMEPECINEAREDLVMNQDTDFYAKWESTENDDNKEKITVKYWYNDGTENIFKIEQMEKGRAIKENGRFDESDIPTRDGYEFKGWYFEPECETVVLPFRTLESDTDFYAKWERKDTGSGSGGGGTTDVKEKVTITYYLNDGTEDIFKRDQIEKGDSPDMSVEPSRKGYEFKGWYYEAECENKVPDDITVDKDTDFYASWKKIDSGSSGGGSGETPDKPDDKEEPIKVTYYENDGTPDIYKTEKIEKGDTPDTSGEPKRDGYEFKGWYEEPECETPVDPSKPLEEDTNFYAKWEKKDTDPSGDDKPDDKNEDDKKPDDKPDRVEKVKVTYHNNDDTDKIYKTEEIEKGGTPDTKGNPDRDKYEFTGWYLDPECKVPVDPSKPLDEDTDLYAGWKKKDTIPTGNGSHGGGGSHGGSTVRVVNVHEDKPEPEKTTIGENGVPQGDTDKEEVNTSTLNENGVPKDRAEEKDSLPKTGDKRNILVYWITFISSLSSMAAIGLKDRLKRVSRQRKN